ncbi:DUF4179 domain-containing protein [Brevibacillus ruminantium]|uniref:DUF4179 domain-containing protein n=1 Tax=Brevibacillus ruminantium TaxID=2950604 RepID=A0ABY4WK81_9BACL|nr:DUF4179 domain-containing protein [Brevibacillus ruminantium]USG67171.1 DUF4179 domain-containing protein [Brevibacillus ruminantium]
MRCYEIRQKLERYVEKETSVSENIEIETHLLDCAACRVMRDKLAAEAIVLKQAVPYSPLTDDFTAGIMNQLEPYPATESPVEMETNSAPSRHACSRTPVQRSKRWARMTAASIAALFVAFSLGMFVSPTFAAYISTFVSRIGGELGLKKAAEQGFNTPVNMAATDQGVTLRVKEIIADPTRLVATYVLEDETGQILPDLFIPHYNGNNIYLTDKQGNILNSGPQIFRRGDQYADFLFSLNNPPNELVLHFDISHFGSNEPRKAVWKLDIPVNIQKSMAATKSVPVNAIYESPQGIVFTFDKVVYAPSATRIDLTTSFTPEKKKQLREMAAAPTGRTDADSIREFGTHRFFYHIVDQSGNVVAKSEYEPNEKQGRRISFTQSRDVRGIDPDIINWHGSYVPADQPEELTFVLDGVELLEPADFSISYSPDSLKQQPVSKTYGELEETFTITDMAKGMDPETQEPVWTIELKGLGKLDSFPYWNLYDKSGKRFDVQTDFGKTHMKNSPDGVVLVQTLIVKGMQQPPQKLTLALQTVKTRYMDLNWQVPIPPNP